MPLLVRLEKTLVSAALAAFLLASANTSRAQDPAAVAAAQALVDDGNRAASAGDFNTALDRFSQAYARFESPNILLNIATAMRRLGRNAEAGNLFERYLRDRGANPQRIDDVRRQLGEIDATVGRLTITTADPSLRIWLDGRELQGFPSGGTTRVEPGQHTVAAGRNAPEMSQVVRIDARESRAVSLGAAVVVPMRVPNAMVVEVPDALDQGADLPRGPRRRSMSGQRVAGIALDVVGGLGVATAFGLGIAALAIHESANDHCLGGGAACEPRALELQARARTYGRVSNICLGAGAGVLLTGIIIGATAPRYDVGSRSGGPRVGVGPGSITLEGSW